MDRRWGPEPVSRRATARPWARLAGRAAVACVVVGAAVAGLTASGLPSAPAALVDGDAWLVHGRDLVHASSQGSAADWMLPDALAVGAEAAAVAQDGDLALVVDVNGERAFSLDAVTLEASDPFAVDPDVRPYVGGGQAYLVGDGQVRWLDPATFEVERSIAVPGSVSATVDGDGILWVLAPRDGSLRRVVRGEVTAEVPVVDPGHDAAITLAGNQPVVHDRDDDRLYFVDRRTGRPGDDVVLPGPATLQGPSQQGDRVWLAGDDGALLGIHPEGDAIEVEVPDVTGALLRPEVTDDRVVVPVDDGRVAVFDGGGQPVGTVAALPAAALGDFRTFTKNGVVWFNAPASGQAGTVDGKGTVHPVDVDEGDLTRRREQTPDPEAPVEPTRVESAALPELPQAPVPATIPSTPPPPPPGAGQAGDGGPTTTASGAPGGTGSSSTTSPTSPTSPTSVPATSTTSTAPTTTKTTTTTSSTTTTTTAVPQSVPVPDVAGRPVTDACTAIEAAGLACDPQDSGQYGTPANTVLGQAPTAGTSLARGGTVAVSYHSSEGVVVPQAGTDRSTACGPLDAVGLVCTLVPVEGGDYPTPDEVYGQSVAPGTRVGPGSTVSVQVESRQAADVWQLDNPANQQLYLTTDAGTAAGWEAQGWRRTNLGRIFLAPAPGTVELDCFEPDGSGDNQSQVFIPGPVGAPPYLRSCGVLGYFPMDGHPKTARGHDVWDYVAHSDHYYSTSASDPLGLELETRGPPNYNARGFGLFN